MSRTGFRIALLVGPLLGVAITARAHHPPRYERCEMFTYTGEIAEIDWNNPHVQVVIRSEDGESHDMGWLNVQALHRAGIDENTLHIGDRVVAEGGYLPQDTRDQPLLLSSLHRTSDDWEWSQPLQGC